MGNNYVKDDDGVWRPSLIWGRQSAGWSRVKIAYRKTSATVWTAFQTFDLTPPAAATITSIVQEGLLLKITVTAPVSSDVVNVRVKVTKGAASTVVDVDSGYVSSPDGSDPAWSDWAVTPGMTRTKYYPVAGDLTSGATYYVTAWAQDSGRNFSAPVSSSQKYVMDPGALLPSARSAYQATTDSRTFYRTSNYWVPDKYVRTGASTDRIGLFYYGTSLATLLVQSIELSKLTLQIQRVNAYDYTGAARFQIFAHNRTTWSNIDVDNVGGKSAILYTDSTWHTLARGATASIVLPGTWYNLVRNGTIRGFGIRSQVSPGTPTDVNWGTYQGHGTNSGRLYAEWVQ